MIDDYHRITMCLLKIERKTKEYYIYITWTHLDVESFFWTLIYNHNLSVIKLKTRTKFVLLKITRNATKSQQDSEIASTIDIYTSDYHYRIWISWFWKDNPWRYCNTVTPSSSRIMWPNSFSPILHVYVNWISAKTKLQL